MDLRAKIYEAVPRLEGWCTPEKALRLAELVRDSQAKLSVELGIFGGRSLIALALGAKQVAGATVHGIDPFAPGPSLEGKNDKANDEWWSKVDYEKVFASARTAVASNGVGDIVTFKRARSLDAVGDYTDGSIDILHVDSNHSEEVSCAEVRVWSSKIAPGGYWVADDTKWPTMQRAQMLIVERGFEHVETHDNWIVFRKST
jgi:predicted O-methyltransferase YrrM